MGDSGLIVLVMIIIPSMAFVFLLTILKTQKVTKEKLEKIFGEKNIEKIKNAKTEEEIKEIIRSLHKSQKRKLKTLLESQDIREVIKAIEEHILERKIGDL
jgi:flagellar motility protein MotE (MotC chaperone)